MTERAVDVFFYGSYINFQVLQEVDIEKRDFVVGSVHGWALTIGPLANLVPQKQGIAYGILMKLTHTELDRLYQEHAIGKLGGVYLPEAVIVCHSEGVFSPALCYISHSMEAKPANPDYVDRILNPAKAYGFPEWYLSHIASLK